MTHLQHQSSWLAFTFYHQPHRRFLDLSEIKVKRVTIIIGGTYWYTRVSEQLACTFFALAVHLCTGCTSTWISWDHFGGRGSPPRYIELCHLHVACVGAHELARLGGLEILSAVYMMCAQFYIWLSFLILCIKSLQFVCSYVKLMILGITDYNRTCTHTTLMSTGPIVSVPQCISSSLQHDRREYYGSYLAQKGPHSSLTC